MNIAEIIGVSPDWAAERRIDYLIERCAEYRTELDFARMRWAKNVKDGVSLTERLTEWYLADVPKLEKKLKRYGKELVMRLRGEEWGNLSIEEIELARQADIRDFADSRNGMINCINPAHQDDKPSMSISRGFANCFACGWHGNVIDFVMTKYNIDFVKAVRMLNGK